MITAKTARHISQDAQTHNAQEADYIQFMERARADIRDDLRERVLTAAQLGETQITYEVTRHCDTCGRSTDTIVAELEAWLGIYLEQLGYDMERDHKVDSRLHISWNE